MGKKGSHSQQALCSGLSECLRHTHRKGDVRVLTLVLHDDEVKGNNICKSEFNVGRLITPKVESPGLPL